MEPNPKKLGMGANEFFDLIHHQGPRALIEVNHIREQTHLVARGDPVPTPTQKVVVEQRPQEKST